VNEHEEDGEQFQYNAGGQDSYQGMIRSISDQDYDSPQMNGGENHEEQPEGEIHCRKTLFIEGELSGPSTSMVQELKVIAQFHWFGVIAVGDGDVPIVRSNVIGK